MVGIYCDTRGCMHSVSGPDFTTAAQTASKLGYVLGPDGQFCGACAGVDQ